MFSAFSEQELLYLIQETIGPIPDKYIENELKREKPVNIHQVVEDPLFKDFILKIMAVDPKVRINAKEALLHPWLN